MQRESVTRGGVRHPRGGQAAPWIALLAALLLGACETANGDAASEGAPAVEASKAEGAAAPEAAPGEKTAEDGESRLAALPLEPEVDDDPERLIGLGPNAVHELLGTPELVRRESPAQIWQYRGESCVFDVVLYDEPLGSEVTYVEARDGSGNVGETRACLNQLLRARLAAASS
ncbi:MAG: hypothetical protein OEM59_11230 [Rhodospirillales bacterium]|nr:hypothetical protein [Rhodospirillales bacterium]